MKKSVSLSLVALLLVVLFCTTGVFASSILDYPDLGVTFSQVVDRGIFLKVPYSSLIGSSITNPVELFNGIVAYLNGNNVKIGFDGVYTSNYSFTSGYLYFWCNSAGVNSINFAKSDSDLAFGSQYAYTSSLIYFESSNTYLHPYDVGITYGSSFDTAMDLIGESVNDSVPSGYALVIQPTSGDVEIIDRSYSIVGSWSFPSLDYPDVHKTNGAIERKLSSSYLVDGFSPDRVFGQYLIPWSPTNTNPSGSSSNYSFTDGTDIILSQFGDTFVITNPIYYGYGDVNSNITRQNSVVLDVNLSIQYSSRPTIRLIALESLQDLTNGQFHYYSVFRPEVYDETGIPSVDGDTTTDVFPSAPSGGGNNGQPPVNENSITGIVSRLVNDIKGFFESAVNGINDLVSSGSGFMQAVGQMFSWLPQPLLLLIVSGFTILLVVGVLKVLWR